MSHYIMTTPSLEQWAIWSTERLRRCGSRSGIYPTQGLALGSVRMGKAADISEFDKGQIVIAQRLETSITEPERRCSEYISKVMHGEPNGGLSSAARWCQREGETVAHCSQRPQSHSATNYQHKQQWRPVQYVTPHSSSLPSAYGPTESTTQQGPHANCTPSPTTLEMESKSIAIGPWRSGRVGWIKIPGASRRRPSAYMAITKRDCTSGCTVGWSQASGGGVMLWGIFSSDTLGSIVPIAQSLTAARYLNIVSDQVHPFMVTVFPDGDGQFHEDNAPCRTARTVKEWFEEYADEFLLMPSVMNLTEHLWFNLENQVHVTSPPLHNVQELEDLVLTFWYQISQETYCHFTKSVLHCMTTVLWAEGHPTGN